MAKNVVLLKRDRMSHRSLISWINDMLSCSIVAMEELKTGAIYCQLMHKLFPEVMPLSKVRLVTYKSADFFANFRLLQNAFHKLKIIKELNIMQLQSGLGHYDMLNWMWKFHAENTTDKPYDAKAERKQSDIGLDFRNSISGLDKKRSSSSAPKHGRYPSTLCLRSNSATGTMRPQFSESDADADTDQSEVTTSKSTSSVKTERCTPGSTTYRTYKTLKPDSDGNMCSTIDNLMLPIVPAVNTEAAPTQSATALNQAPALGKTDTPHAQKAAYKNTDAFLWESRFVKLPEDCEKDNKKSKLKMENKRLRRQLNEQALKLKIVKELLDRGDDSPLVLLQIRNVVFHNILDIEPKRALVSPHRQ